MTMWCWYCRRYSPEGEFVRSRPDDVRLYTGQRVAYLKHLKCRRKTIVNESMAGPKRDRIGTS